MRAMTVIALTLRGFKAAARRPRTASILWLANLLAALPLYVLFTSWFGAALGSSGLARGLTARTDMNAIVEVLTASGAALRETLLAAVLLIAVHQITAIFLAGGILETLGPDAEPRPFAAAFFGGGGRFYGRFLRLEAFSLLLWMPAAFLYLAFDAVLSGLQADPMREQLGFYLVLARIGFALILIHFIRLILDYARIGAAARDARGMLLELGRAAAFVVRHPGRTLALYYLPGLAGLAAFALFLIMDGALPKTPGPAIGAGFALTQIFIFVRGGLRIAGLSAERGFYLGSQDAGGQVKQGPDELEAGPERDADQAERQEKQPDQRIEEKDQKGQGPADDQQDQP
jgi:hypothetical protein